MRKGYKRPAFSEEWRANISKAHKGKKKPSRSAEHRRKIGDSKRGVLNPLFGKHLSAEHRQKISVALRSRPKISEEERKLRKRLSEARRRSQTKGEIIFPLEWEMMKWIYDYLYPACLKGEPEIRLTIDHITPLSHGGTSDVANIQPLCHGCNSGKRNFHSTCYVYPSSLINS